MKKFVSIVLALVLALSLVACGNTNETANETVYKIAASATPHAEILEDVVKPLMAEKGYTIEVEIFDDYVQPNNVVEEGEYYANYFQHAPYLDSFNAENGTHIVSLCAVHYEPYAVYPGTKADLSELADGDKIAVPNDPSNEARALQLLAAAGVIKLADDAGLDATVLDITEYSKEIEILELSAEQLPLRLQDVAFAVINGNYAAQAGLTPADDGLYVEDAEGVFAQTYANVVCVKEGNEDSDFSKALAECCTSAEVKDYISATYTTGNVLSIF